MNNVYPENVLLLFQHRFVLVTCAHQFLCTLLLFGSAILLFPYLFRWKVAKILSRTKATHLFQVSTDSLMKTLES